MKIDGDNQSKLSTDFNAKSINLMAPALVVVAALSIIGIVYIVTTEVKTSMVFSLVGIVALVTLAIFSLLIYQQIKSYGQHLSHMEKLNHDHLSFLEKQNKQQTDVLLDLSGKIEKLDSDINDHNDK